MTTTIKQHIKSLPLDERADFIKDYNELQTELKQLNNMTKVSVFGKQSPEQPKKLKKIEFVKFFNGHATIDAAFKPISFDNVVLLSENYCETNFDLFYAYDENEQIGNIYLGHWNDGVI